MNLLEQFETMDQTYKNFKLLFNVHLPEIEDGQQVSIGNVINGRRKVLIEDKEFLVNLPISKKRIIQEKKPKKTVKKNYKKHEKRQVKLNSFFKLLKPSEFMIYYAIKESENKICSIEELSKHINLSTKTISKSLNTLKKMNLVKIEYVTCEKGSFNLITIDKNTILH